MEYITRRNKKGVNILTPATGGIGIFLASFARSLTDTFSARPIKVVS
jgi:hypothetical protein